MVVYLKWAKRTVLDIPNERSSHKEPTVSGGGIIFVLAVLYWGFLFNHSAWLLISSVLLIGLIGFIDDRYSLHQGQRLFFQSLSVLMLLYYNGVFEFTYLYIGIGFVLITGWLNTFNFMDGINGISVIYAACVILGVFLFKESVSTIPVSLMYSVGISLIIFGFLNVRKKAVVFAGDLGSLSLGLILAYFILDLILTTGRWEFIIFLSVYGVDSVMTIVYRIIKGENIFEAHRNHLYQCLANELKISHVSVSLLYGALQLTILTGFMIIPAEMTSVYAIVTLIILVTMYILAKYIIHQKLLNYESYLKS
jgi:UDP-N-acetylmuramyl pentapeptide phosphotransferase/UDP-N-acetylglucosamine-1-phosphate transferase